MNHVLITALMFWTFVSYVQGQTPRPPNILWITCEDMSPHLGSYGDSQVKTPNLDKLASQGIRYTNAFATAGVCAPSRSAIITGMHQQSIGTQHMRTQMLAVNKDAYPPNYVGYSAVLPVDVKCFPELLRAAGYYCTNNFKEDYQFEAPPTVWDESSKSAHWRNRANSSQPFFSVFNIMTTHESQVWARSNEPLLVDPKIISVPPYYPDIPEVRLDIARHLSNVMVMDRQAGEILMQLQEDGLEDNTIVFFFSDHGDGLPFVKREIYDRGIRVPLIIRFGENVTTNSDISSSRGVVDNQLISLVDLPATVLSLTGAKIPDYMHGQAFLGPAKRKPRTHIFAARDRMDSEYDRVRAIRDARFLYLRNYMPDKPYYQNIQYRLQQPMMPAILQMKDEGKLNQQQMLWFRERKSEEELYDCTLDPFQLKNLVDDPRYKTKLRELSQAFDAFLKKAGDMSDKEEPDMVSQWWNGQEGPPATDTPTALIANDSVTISSKTPGASIGYKFKWKENWSVYSKPLAVNRGDSLYVLAQRIGYLKSDLVSIRLYE